jgi:hypothetical protein
MNIWDERDVYIQELHKFLLRVLIQKSRAVRHTHARHGHEQKRKKEEEAETLVGSVCNRSSSTTTTTTPHFGVLVGGARRRVGWGGSITPPIQTSHTTTPRRQPDTNAQSEERQRAQGYRLGRVWEKLRRIFACRKKKKKKVSPKWFLDDFQRQEFTHRHWYWCGFAWASDPIKRPRAHFFFI